MLEYVNPVEPVLCSNDLICRMSPALTVPAGILTEALVVSHELAAWFSLTLVVDQPTIPTISVPNCKLPSEVTFNLLSVSQSRSEVELRLQLLIQFL